MSGQRYKRTNFDDEETLSNGGSTPTQMEFAPGIMFKGGVNVWQRKSALERILLVLLVILLVILIIIASLLAVKEKEVKYLTTQNKTVCLTPNCVIVASNLLSSMDRTVNPCEDYFKYACGGWIKAHPIPSGHSHWGTFEDLWQKNQLVMKNLIEQPEANMGSLAERKAKRYYKSCIDNKKIIERLGAKPLKRVLDMIIKENNDQPPSQQIQDLLEEIHLLDITALFNVWVGEDDKNSSKNILHVDQAGLGLPERDYYLNKSITEDKVLKAYLKYMVDVQLLLANGDGSLRNETTENMIEVIKFETLLANATVPNSERRGIQKLYHKMTIAEIQKKFPMINWLSYFNRLLGIVNISVTNKEEVVFYAPTYISALTDILKKSLQDENGQRIVKNYLVWHVIKAFAPLLSKKFRDAKEQYSEAIEGMSVSGKDDLWRTCITDTNSVLGFALGAMFVRETLHGESRYKAEEMIEMIKTAFKKNLPKLTWMDAKTRLAAIDKADAVVNMIGFPQYILNATQLDKEYEKLFINESEYFYNNVRNLKYQLAENLKTLRKPPKKNSWSMTPATINAYYTPSKNEIVFPAGILQAPFYDQTFPKSLNFGAMGVVMGHELTHGFDDQGREFDKHGNLRPWWNNDSVIKFNERAQCMTDQYSSYKLNGKNMRGKQTLGENIADNGGLKSAFNAYVSWIEKHGEEPPLPAIGLSHKQLFFLAFAQVWCSSSTKEAIHLEIVTDAHSPASIRVLGTLSNSNIFAKLYNCPVGSRMNPKKKCEVW
ncbi:hypothetical protein LOTGIDRAFT_213427 [Lottia gigantea]|uniref:Endothelin-converting enzyme 1 n=1 Tax=Lottia gigantea TaxID=225164 RepID=V4AWR9_LOTGI|nr:hypothetical protein LOTGIDRAFT_213427 [Lottia gigantea]ESO99465.1 hypothetical protein LOTGIDRAFT_213427 [Lottia gigantea]